ncbi:MAG: hypothetical protein LLF98_02510 [Clostridium sp.]|uniref:hypothetical protein n=1 Tax=Clostridium sp. TaxID=1506 RepID=UPI0025C60CD4|nr:hypothetical protein [Clostridium sp.]MCE5220155.1 hypothetical protein [Clostridium sp.]
MNKYKIDKLPTGWIVYNNLFDASHLTKWQKFYIFIRYDVSYWFIIRWERFKDIFRRKNYFE